MRRIFEAKGRPQDNPLILHVTGAQWLPRYCADVPPLAYVLARKFWPGPLTMILKRRAHRARTRPPPGWTRWRCAAPTTR